MDAYPVIGDHAADCPCSGCRPPDLTIGHAHRTLLRRIGRGEPADDLSHLLADVCAQGLAERSRPKGYRLTPSGVRVLAVYDGSMEALAESWERTETATAVARVAARANRLHEELRQLERDLHALEVGATDPEYQRRFRGAEVSAQHAGELVWAAVCMLDGAGS